MSPHSSTHHPPHSLSPLLFTTPPHTILLTPPHTTHHPPPHRTSLPAPPAGIYESPTTGWIEGAAILFAVLLVAVVTATNDYRKESQFRKLSAKKDDVTIGVIRNSESININVKELVSDLYFVLFYFVLYYIICMWLLYT